MSTTWTRANPGRLTVGPKAVALAMVGAVLASILTLPIASATTISAPYKGVVQPATDVVIQGCAKVATPVKGTFSLKTGVYSYSANSSSHACKVPAGYVQVSFADQESLINGAIHLTIPGGVHSVAITWRAAWSFSGSENHPGTACPVVTTRYSWGNVTEGYCDASSQVDFLGESSVYDASNRTTLPVTGGGPGVFVLNYTENYNDTYWVCYRGGSCTGSNLSANSTSPSYAWIGSSSGTSYVNSTFVTGHHYVLLFQVLGAALANCQGWSPCTAKASLNLGAASGYGIKLVSISVT